MLGGWGNQYSVIRKHKQEREDVEEIKVLYILKVNLLIKLFVKTPKILSPTEMRSFWIDLEVKGEGLKITVGRGDSEVVMSRSWDTNPAKSWPPTHVAFAGWDQNKTVDYEFCLTGELTRNQRSVTTSSAEFLDILDKMLIKDYFIIFNTIHF